MKGGFLKPKLTEELIEVMCGLKAKGMHNKDICMAVGIHEATLYRWLNKPSSKLHRALGEQFKKAEAQYKQELLDSIRETALSKPRYWTAAAWLLERKYPEEFGRPETRKTAVETEDAPKIVLGVEVRTATGDSADTNG